MFDSKLIACLTMFSLVITSLHAVENKNYFNVPTLTGAESPKLSIIGDSRTAIYSYGIKSKSIEGLKVKVIEIYTKEKYVQKMESDKPTENKKLEFNKRDAKVLVFLKKNKESFLVRNVISFSNENGKLKPKD